MVKNQVNEAIRQFELIEGGKADIPITKAAPKGPDGEDWLRGLDFGTQFLCRGKHNRGCFLDNYGVAQVLPFAILLYNFLPNYGASPYHWVDSFKFSQDHILVGVLPIPPEEEGNKDGQHHLPPPEPRQEHDGHEGPA